MSTWISTHSSVDSNDPIEDLDPAFGEEDAFDAINTLLPLTVVYGEYILQTNNRMLNSIPKPTNRSFVRC
jgi:hypothetical protein